MAHDDDERMWQTLLREDPELAGVREVERARRIQHREPRFPLGSVVTATGISETTLRNWLTRGRLKLDADAARSGRASRLFSQRDAVLIAVLHSLGNVGLPITEAMPIADKLMPVVDNMATRLTSAAGEPVLYMWKDQDKWRSSNAYEAKMGLLANQAIPVAAITIRPMSILHQVLEGLSGKEG